MWIGAVRHIVRTGAPERRYGHWRQPPQAVGRTQAPPRGRGWVSRRPRRRGWDRGRCRWSRRRGRARWFGWCHRWRRRELIWVGQVVVVRGELATGPPSVDGDLDAFGGVAQRGVARIVHAEKQRPRKLLPPHAYRELVALAIGSPLGRPSRDGRHGRARGSRQTSMVMGGSMVGGAMGGWRTR